ncbi:MAG: serine/threonine protein kinase [Acidobacteria bacterium]|nr:serine/threonine protein kinase [Acidobacteriota bacterium]
MIKPNDQIGPYTLIRQLGKGGFGVVWLAERRSRLATTQVAIKLILDDEPDIDAIAKESQVWVQAGGHPNVLSIIEANVYDNQVAIVSEYVSDGSLQDFLKQNKTVSLTDSLNLTFGILAGLEHLHSRKILHRDLKPANILLNKGVPRLADFGLARVMKSSSNSGSVAGTPSYMAPEAFDGKRVVVSDIWSVGVIFYQLLSNRLPFPQIDMTALVGAIINRKPEPLPGNIPDSIQAIVQKALEKDPSKRFESATEMKLALQKIIAEVDLPTLDTEAITARLSGLAANTSKHISKVNKEKSNTFSNRLNTNTLPQGEFLNTPNQTLQPTEKVLKKSFQSIPPTEVIKAAPSKWKPYVGLGIMLLAIPLAVFTYSSSTAENTTTLQAKKVATNEKTGELIVSDKLPSTSGLTLRTTDLTEQDPEQKAWQKVKGRKLEELQPGDVKAYLNDFPTGAHAIEAKVLLKEIEKRFAPQNVSVADPTAQVSQLNDKNISLPNQISNQIPTQSTSSSKTSGMYMKTSSGQLVEVEALSSDARGQSGYSQDNNILNNIPYNKPLKDNPYGFKKPDWQNRQNDISTIAQGSWREEGGNYNGRIITFGQNGQPSLSDGSPVKEWIKTPRGIGFKTFDGRREYKVEIEFISDKEALKTCRSHDGYGSQSRLIKQ